MRSATPPGSLGNTVKFWDQIWGPAAYLPVHPLGELRADVLFRDRLQYQPGGQLWRRLPGPAVVGLAEDQGETPRSLTQRRGACRAGCAARRLGWRPGGRRPRRQQNPPGQVEDDRGVG